jgi:putative ABC transport system permease protein
MFKNYLKIAFRNLARNKAFSFINIFGLSVGLATCLLIMLYVFDESGYDSYHKNAGDIYRIAYTSDKEGGGKAEAWPALAAPLAGGVKSNIPEVEQAARLLKFPGLEKMLLTYKSNNEVKQFYETNGFYIDSSFFQIFNYNFLYGSPLTSLKEPNSMVLSESVYHKLFGNENPVGKTITVGTPFGEFTYSVKGVFKEENIKTHIPAHFFLGMNNDDVGGWVQAQTNWINNNIFHTYVKLKPGADGKSFEKKLDAFIQDHSGADLKAQGTIRKMFVQPLKDIYLHSNLNYEIAPNGNITYLYILGSIAAFILLIACINFMNLSTARSEKRAREVGVRKVMGAERGMLVRQFLGESFLMCIIALALALFMVTLFLPLFNELTQKELSLFSDSRLVLWITGLTILTGLLAGFYPAFYLSSFRPVTVLKGKLLNSFSASAIRKGLVILQFTVSVCLILGAIVISYQLKHINSQPLGFNKSQQIILPLRSTEAQNRYAALKSELLKNPAIKTVTSGSTYPGIQNIYDMLVYGEDKTKEQNVDLSIAAIENDYFKTLGITLAAGREFSTNVRADSASVILNETAVRDLGYTVETAPGTRIQYDLRGNHLSMQIVGVVKDFNFESLHNKIKPMGFTTTNFANRFFYLVADVQTNNYATLLSTIEQSWKGINPNLPFVYSFLDQDFQKNYEKEQRTSGIVLYFTVIAILVACLGLFGLAAFSAERRTKEIGIRKVLGASAANVTTLLSKDFIKLVIIAIIIASPIAWYGMNKWLQNFAYRIDVEWWMFVVAGLSAIMIALITVSFQAIKAALMNPVKSLRTE